MESHTHELVLSDDEKEIQRKARAIWKGILNAEIDEETDFFTSGAGSMDVVRSVLCVRHL